jgi:hypothetical protein
MNGTNYVEIFCLFSKRLSSRKEKKEKEKKIKINFWI